MNEQLRIIISAETNKLKEGISEAKHAVSTFKSEINKNKEAINKAWNTVGQASVNATKKMVTGAAGIVTALAANSAATEEYRQNQAQLNAAFEQAGFTTQSAKDAYQQLYKVIGDDDQAVESAANIAMLADSEQEAAKWAELASGVLGTFHDTLQPEAFYEAANETLKLGEATGAFTQMLEQTGVMSVDEFNKKLSECSTEAEKQAFMLEVSEKAMGAAGDSYDKATEKIQAQREAQAELKDTLGKLGEAVSPLLTAFTNFANDALAAVTPYIQNLAETYGPQLADALDRVGQALQPVAEFISNHLGAIATVAGIIAGIAIAYGLITTAMTIYTTVTTLWTAATTIATAVQGAFAAVNAAACAPILLVVAAIAAIIAIIVLCVKHWDEIKATVEKVVAAIKEKVNEMVEKVTAKFEELKAKATEKIQSMKESVSNKFNEIKSNVQEKINNAKQAAIDGFNNMKSSAVSTVTGMVSSIKGKFDDIRNGVKEKINAAKDAVKSAIDTMKGFLNFSWSLPKLKMPHVSISGKFSINPPSAPKFSISWYKLGGVFDSPTLFPWAGGIGGLGEDGAEAIVPLEKNTQWLDRLAERLAAKQNGIPIILQVDGKTFAQVAIDSINALTKQRGTLGLNLV